MIHLSYHSKRITIDQNIQRICITIITQKLSMQERGTKEKRRGKEESKEVEAEKNERKEKR